MKLQLTDLNSFYGPAHILFDIALVPSRVFGQLRLVAPSDWTPFLTKIFLHGGLAASHLEHVDALDLRPRRRRSARTG